VGFVALCCDDGKSRNDERSLLTNDGWNRMEMVAEVVPSFDWGWRKAWLLVMSTS
jgi:hypothetical protein